MHLSQPEILDEWCLNSYNHLQSYQNRVRIIYNKDIKSHKFQLGGLVLKENQRNQQDWEKKGKFEDNWLGTYVITSKYGSGAYHLDTPKEEPLDEPINIIYPKSSYVMRVICVSFHVIFKPISYTFIPIPTFHFCFISYHFSIFYCIWLYINKWYLVYFWDKIWELLINCLY